MKKSFRFALMGNNRGLSLMEAMIASGMVGVTALGVMSIAQMSARTQMAARASTDYNGLQTYLQSVTRNDTTCKSVVQWKAGTGANANRLPSAVPAGGTEVDLILNTGATPLQAGGQYGVLRIDQMKLVLNKVEALSNGDRLYTADIEGKFIKPSGGYGGTAPLIPNPIPVMIRTQSDRRTIVNCGSASAPTNTEKCDPGEVLVSSDGTKFECKKVMCPSGQHVSKYTTDGYVEACEEGSVPISCTATTATPTCSSDGTTASQTWTCNKSSSDQYCTEDCSKKKLSDTNCYLNNNWGRGHTGNQCKASGGTPVRLPGQTQSTDPWFCQFNGGLPGGWSEAGTVYETKECTTIRENYYGKHQCPVAHVNGSKGDPVDDPACTDSCYNRLARVSDTVRTWSGFVAKGSSPPSDVNKGYKYTVWCSQYEHGNCEACNIHPVYWGGNNHWGTCSSPTKAIGY